MKTSNYKLLILIGFISTISLTLLGAISHSPTFAQSTPTGPFLCSENQVSFLGLNNGQSAYDNGGSGFYVCFTSPQKMEAKIQALNLVKADGTRVSLLPQGYNPTYQDLVAGNLKLVDSLSLSQGSYDGVYSGIELVVDNEIKIVANASYSGAELAGGTKYCHTTDVGLNSFQGSLDGIPSAFGSSNTVSVTKNAFSGTYETPASPGGTSSYDAPGTTIFRFDGSPGVSPGLTGVERVLQATSTTLEGAYWAKISYTLSGDATSGEMKILDRNFAYTRQPTLYDVNTNTGSRNSKYVSWLINFTNDLIIDSTTNSTIDLKFDFTKAVGFAFGYRFNGTSPATWNTTDCHRMVVGALGVSLSITK